MTYVSYQLFCGNEIFLCCSSWIADLVISIFCYVWENLALMSLLSIEISARFHRNRATFHNSLNCEMEWWMDGWMLTMMFLFQAITFRYWLIWTDFWFKYCFSRSNPILNIHPSLTLPLVVCLCPLQLNIPPTPLVVCLYPLLQSIHPPPLFNHCL